jgi:LPXTG-motif cell wall-anchored protein
MSYRIRSMTTVVLGSLLVLAMFSTAAFAQYPTAEAFGVGCTPERQVAGQLTTCTVVGAVPGETLTVTVRAGNTLVLSETLTADEDGRASFSFTVPEGRAAVVIQVVGSESGTTSTTLLPAQAADRAVERARGSDLPRTGQDTAILALGGALLLAVGGGAVARSRRRNKQHVDA